MHGNHAVHHPERTGETTGRLRAPRRGRHSRRATGIRPASEFACFNAHGNHASSGANVLQAASATSRRQERPIGTALSWCCRRSIRIPRSGTEPSPSRRDAPGGGLASGPRVNLRYTTFAGALPVSERLERANELRAKASGHLATGHTRCTLVQGGPPCPYRRRSSRWPSKVARRTVRRPGGSRCPCMLRATLPEEFSRQRKCRSSG